MPDGRPCTGEPDFRSLIENASDVITVVGPGLEILFQTGSGARLLGYAPPELKGRKFSSLVDPASLGALRAACAAAADGTAVRPVELRLRHQDGSWIDAETVVRLDAELGQLVLTSRDARERKRAERKLRLQAKQQAVVAALGARALQGEDLPELMLDAATEVQRSLGAQYAGVHQYLPERESFVLFAGTGLEAVRRNGTTMAAAGSHLGATLRSESTLIVSDWERETRFAEAAFFRAHGLGSGVSVPIPAKQGPFGVLTVQSEHAGQFNYEDGVFLQSIANILAAAIGRCEDEGRIRHQALHDVVTGLPNRVLFEDRLTRALATARRHDRSLAVLFLDLDNFKRVNDSLGHASGDEVLQTAARRLSSCLRAEDTLARFGGDEFVVLLPEIDDERGWVPVVDRIAEALREPMCSAGRQILTSVSVGVAIGGACEPAKDAPALVRDADLAMYAAKQRGPGQCEVFAEQMYEAAVQRLDLIGDLHQALERGEFQAHFQPIVSLASESIVGLEALVRWHHPRHGLLAPGTFLPLAEETGLIVPLGRQVLSQACHHLRRWQRSDPRHADLYVTVNLASQEVHAPDLVPFVKAVLAETGLSASSLVLEITEGVLLRTEDEALVCLRELKDLGVRMAVDDFGTGYSALSYLQHFPMDILKIDKTFIDRLGEHADQERLVNGIIELAHGVNLVTIAEGIETPAQAAALRGMHAGLGQGFHFAKPLSPESVDALMGSAAPIATAA